jgi:hypothetical protein
VESSRNLCFLGSGGGVYILDISTPASAHKTGEIKTSGVVDDLFYDNSSGLLYIAAQRGGLEIWDVSHAESSRKVGTYATDRAAGVFVSGSYAYVVDTVSSHAGLKVVDVSNPASPQEVGSCPMPDGGSEFRQRPYGGVFVAGAYAYVADGGAGLQVVDVSDFGNLHVVGSCDMPGFASRVFITGSHAYLGGWQLGLQVIDVSDPFNPYVLGVCDEPDYTEGISVVGDYAYVSSWSYGLHVIDVTNPANPYEVGSFDTPGRAYTGVSTDVVVSGSYAYIADGDAGLRVVNISNPANPYEVGSFDTPGLGRSVVVSDSLAYLSATGLRVLDISDPEVPREMGAFDYTELSTPQHSYDVFVSGSYAYLGGYPGLWVFDISNPSNPSELASCNTECSVFSVFVSGSYAYLGAIEAELQALHVIDISNPRDPREVGSFIVPLSWPNYISDVFVADRYAYIAAMEGGLRVIDVSNATNPHEVGCCETLSSANGVFVSGSYAYVADNNGLCVIDVSNPSQPHEVRCYDTPGYAWDVSVSDSKAYVGDSSGLRIFDISNPSHAREVGWSDTPAGVDHVFVSGSYAYVMCHFAGLQIYEFLGESGNSLPIADAGPDEDVVDGDGDGSEQVNLDGSRSEDPDGTIESFIWTEGGIQIAAGVNPTVVLAVGVHTITLTVTDNDGDADTDDVVITITAPSAHTVSTPNTPSGPSSGQVDESLPFSTSGSACSQGHSVQYRFDWGNGNYSNWSSATSTSYSYSSAGTYQVKAQARCASSTSVVSNWSGAKTVVVDTATPSFGTFKPGDLVRATRKLNIRNDENEDVGDVFAGYGGIIEGPSRIREVDDVEYVFWKIRWDWKLSENGADILLGEDEGIVGWTAEGSSTGKWLLTDDVYWLAKALTNEARGQDELARRAVGYTVLNRLNYGSEFGSDIHGVVIASNGYAPYWDKPHQEPTRSDIVGRAEIILAREVSDPTDGATHFFSPMSQAGTNKHPVPGTGKEAYYARWAEPKGGWAVLSDTLTHYVNIDNREWRPLKDINPWEFMFYRPYTTRVTAAVRSPVELRVIDSEGRVTGLVGGEVVTEIPDAAYHDNTVTIFFPLGFYRYEIEGTNDGSYSLIVSAVTRDGNIDFVATDIPAKDDSNHRYSIRWDVLAQSEEGVTVQVDADGDGTFEQTITSGSELGGEDFGVITTEEFVSHGPNPVTGAGTAFFYALPEGTSTARLMIYGVSGRLLFETPIDADSTRFPSVGTWNPVDQDGIPLANGPYIYVLIADGKTIGHGKMVIQR